VNAEVAEKKCGTRAWRQFSNFFENAFADHLKRRILILNVGFRLSATA
jgi:hypothetical protein